MSQPARRASWQLRLASESVRRFVRRERWGDEVALVRRARASFGAPAPVAMLAAVGLDIRAVAEGGIRGEWITPRNPRPGVILYIHGGGFVSCSSRTHRPLTTWLARHTRRRVFSVDYRLAPEARFPAAFDDVVAAYRWLLESGAAPSSSIAIAGDSAGGGLALSLLVAIRESNLPRPCCGYLASPWLDLTASGASVRTNAGRCAMFAPGNMKEFADVYLGEAAAADERASPLFSDLSELPPILIQVGDSELLFDDAARLHEKLCAARVESVLETSPHVFHGWQMLVGLVPESGEALRRCSAFITSHMDARPRNARSLAPD
ncbi:MAG TPA: alpha/beta hydrolase [Gemmatimonadaceae bacterium]|nr:alpha/beta hydrolase [Gemmatimonadaceae bacterium]